MKKTILTVCAVLAGLVLGLACLSVYLGHRQAALLSQPPSHGTAFIIEAGLSGTPGDTNTMAALKETLRNRFSKFGTRIFWEPISASRVRISVPITDAQAGKVAQNLISRRGFLEFRLVNENSDELVRQGDVPPGYEMLKREEDQPGGSKRVETVLVKKEPGHGLAGGIVKNAMVVRGNLGEPQIDFRLNPESTTAFAEITRENIGHRLAIVLDGQLYSAPVIQSPIESGYGQIAGHFDEQEAMLLAILLEDPLPVSTTVLESNSL
jgi:preprotein translocase subunit SecD